jgi:hypothetical protein
MNLVVIDPTVFVAGVFWRHEPHLCLRVGSLLWGERLSMTTMSPGRSVGRSTSLT